MSIANTQQLPGGLLIDGLLHRQFDFKPVVGELEVLFSEARTQVASFPALVTEVLFQALQSLAGQEPTKEQVRELSVGDRQFLVLQLASHLGSNDENWISAGCTHCGEKMDLSFHYSDLPVKPAAQNFPRFEARLGRRNYKIRVPTGKDQEAIANTQDEATALNVLLESLVLSVSNEKERAGKLDLNDKDIQKLEKLIEDASPEVGTQIVTQCPHCSTENTLSIDLYQFLRGNVDQLITDVHDIAIHYHWSETEILRLPRERRKRYLALIDRSRGMVGS